MLSLINNVGILHFLILSAVVFVTGLAGIFMNRKNIITILMSIELILVSANLNLVAFSTFLQDMTGQIFTIMIMTVAAAETAVGLAILVSYYRNKGNINSAEMNGIKE